MKTILVFLVFSISLRVIMINREQFLSITSSFLVKEGCRKVTMDEIAALNGISKRTLYENFTDKNDVLTRCVEYVHGIFNSRLELYLAGKVGLLDVIGFFHSEEGSRKTYEFNRFMKEIRRYFPEIFAKNTAVYKETHIQKMACLLSRAQEEGFVRKGIDLDQHAVILTGLCETAMALDDTGNRSLQIHRTLFNTYLRGLASNEGLKVLDDITVNCERRKNNK